jgi:hypothetical protein
MLSSDEAAQFGTFRTALPEGWVVELHADDPSVAWVAFVYKVDAPRRGHIFTVCRWGDRMGLFAQWVDGYVSCPMAFTELGSILRLILDGIFAATQAQLTTVPTEGWTKTQH